MKIKNQKDFYSGLMFIVVGCAFAAVSLTYKMGTASRMGPGYLPFWLGTLLTLLGAVVLLSSLSPRSGLIRVDRWDLRGILWVLGSVVLFGLILNSIGLVLSLIVLVYVSSKASHEYNWIGTGINAIILVLISLALFVYGLNLQVDMWPEFIGG